MARVVPERGAGGSRRPSCLSVGQILDCHKEIIESLLVMMPNRLRDPSFFFKIVLVCCSEYMSAEECSLQKRVKVLRVYRQQQQSFSRCQDVPTFIKYRWRRREGDEHSAATIIWTLIREVSKTCHELAKCSCKKNFPSRCK